MKLTRRQLSMLIKEMLILEEDDKKSGDHVRRTVSDDRTADKSGKLSNKAQIVDYIQASSCKTGVRTIENRATDSVKGLNIYTSKKYFPCDKSWHLEMVIESDDVENPFSSGGSLGATTIIHKGKYTGELLNQKPDISSDDPGIKSEITVQSKNWKDSVDMTKIKTPKYPADQMKQFNLDQMVVYAIAYGSKVNSNFLFKKIHVEGPQYRNLKKVSKIIADGGLIADFAADADFMPFHTNQDIQKYLKMKERPSDENEGVIYDLYNEYSDEMFRRRSEFAKIFGNIG